MSLFFSVSPHHERGPGHALLEVRGGEFGDAPPELLLAITRSDGQQLGPDGWRRPPADLAVERVECREEVLLISLGPEIVDNLDTLETYRLELHFPQGRHQTGTVAWRDIPSSPVGNQPDHSCEPSPRPAEPVAAEERPEPAPEDEPVSSPEPAPRQPARHVGHQGQPDPEPATEAAPPPPPRPDPELLPRAWVVGVIVGVSSALTVGIMYTYLFHGLR